MMSPPQRSPFWKSYYDQKSCNGGTSWDSAQNCEVHIWRKQAHRPTTVSTYVLCFLYSCIYVFELIINKWVVQQLITENSEVSHSIWEPVTTAMTMKIELYKYLLWYHSAVFKFRQVLMSLSKKYFQISSILIDLCEVWFSLLLQPK